MNKNKSAKDIAWDRERAKYQKRIKDLNEMVEFWQEKFKVASDTCSSLSEENTKLKGALNLSEEDLKLLLDKATKEKHLASLFGVIDRMSSGGSYL